MLSRRELQDLMGRRGENLVSLYLPTHRSGIEAHQHDPIHLKNVLKEAEAQLEQRGLRPNQINDRLAPARRLLDDNDFWAHVGDGLALFLGEGEPALYRLPIEFAATAWVGERFYLKPLLPLLVDDGRYYVLAFSLDQVRLFQGRRYRIDELQRSELPESMAEALKWDDPEKQLQHQGTSGEEGPGVGTAVFHGHGVANDNRKKTDILRYCHKIDDAVNGLLTNQQVPLVLVAVEYVASIYKEANHYPNLMDQVVEGNPEVLKPEQIHEKTWAVVEPHFRAQRERDAAQYAQLVSGERASNRLSDVLPAAHEGRVQALWISCEDQVPGRYEPTTRRVERASDGHDLLDIAAVQTLLNSGTVYAVSPQDLPDEGPLAALFRY